MKDTFDDADEEDDDGEGDLTRLLNIAQRTSKNLGGNEAPSYDTRVLMALYGAEQFGHLSMDVDIEGNSTDAAEVRDIVEGYANEMDEITYMAALHELADRGNR